MTIVDISAATKSFPALVERAEAGEEIQITRNGKPVARLGSSQDKPTEIKPRFGGQWEGKVWIAPDFDEWPDDIAEALGMRNP